MCGVGTRFRGLGVVFKGSASASGPDEGLAGLGVCYVLKFGWVFGICSGLVKLGLSEAFNACE